MKRSISTLAPQRPHVAHLCNATLDRAPASQAAPHHHHRCHRRRDRKQRSLEKGPGLSADTDGGVCKGTLKGRWLELGGQEPMGTLFLVVPHAPAACPGSGDQAGPRPQLFPGTPCWLQGPGLGWDLSPPPRLVWLY